MCVPGSGGGSRREGKKCRGKGKMDTRTQNELEVTNVKKDPTSGPLVMNHNIQYIQTLDTVTINACNIKSKLNFFNL